MPRTTSKKESMLRITQRKSGIGAPQKQKRTLKALGLGKLNRTVELPDRPEIRGMITRVRHLLEVEEAGK